jgi:hypothetical protein
LTYTTGGRRYLAKASSGHRSKKTRNCWAVLGPILGDYIARTQKINFLKIQNIVESEGGVFLPEYFSIDYVDEILNSLSHVLNSGINNNMSGPVYFNDQIFVSQVLAHSEVVFNFMCDHLFELSKHVLADPVVKAARYYETGPGRAKFMAS